MTFISAVTIVGLCASLVLAASIPEAGQSQSPAVQAQGAASTNAEQPVAAESSYGSYNSYSPKYKSSYDSYSHEYSAPYITGSCYGQYPGMFGNADYDCKSYRVCQADGRLDVLYCPPYTRFNNYLGVCDWHFKVDSYCNPLYKEEYNSYEAHGYEKPYYGSYGHDSSYSHKSYEKSYEKPIYNAGYESPKYSSNYEAPHSYGSGYGSYEAPSYGHRSVYKKY